MQYDSRIRGVFQSRIVTSQRDLISSRMLDQSSVEDYFSYIDSEIESSLQSIAELDEETAIYDLILGSLVTGINDYLDQKVQEFISQDLASNTLFTYGQGAQSSGMPVTSLYTPLYSANAPALISMGTGFQIPYQVHYAYLGKDLEGSRVPGVDLDDYVAPSLPNIRKPSAYSVEFNGDVREAPNGKLDLSDPVYEFFLEGLEIYYIRPYFVSSGSGMTMTYEIEEEKVVVLDSSDPTLASMLLQAKETYALFEESRNGVEDVNGSFSESVAVISQILRYSGVKERINLRNSMLEGLLEV